MHLKTLCATLTCGLGLIAGPASAAVITFSGYDEGASAPGANTLAAQASFLAATGALSVIDFESPVPSGVTVTGGTVRTTPPGAAQYWGSNTTPGGSRYLDFIGNVTFTFASPINSFGLIMGGLQGPNTITWTNSSGSQQISVANHGGNGGFAFLGFTDIGQTITSITISSPGDYDGLDDVRFGNAGVAAVPEPTTWATLMLGFGALGFAMRRGRKTAVRVRYA